MENGKLEGIINYSVSDSIVPFRTMRHIPEIKGDTSKNSRFCKYMDIALVETAKLSIYTTAIVSYFQ